MSLRSLSPAGFLWIAVAAALVPALVFAQTQPADLPAVPQGVEVLARGPVHEAYAAPNSDPQPGKAVAKRPPKPINEVPPDQKPEGQAIWVAGYWAWDDDRNDFLWVSGVWRTPPPGKQWVPGYWREENERWQWVAGFWTTVAEQPGQQPVATQQIQYLTTPPAPPEVAPPGAPPVADSFFVPGYWTWNGATYVWRAGYWARVQPGYVWVAASYRWTPTGYVFVPGYWDLAISRRGVLYAPVVIDPAVVGVGFVYTPYYAVSDVVIVESLWVRPAFCHYYFGDYYGVVYADLGFEFAFLWGRRRYEPIIVYESWHRRADPTWIDVQIRLAADRRAGRVPPPPRTLAAQLAAPPGGPGRPGPAPVVLPHNQIVAAKGLRSVPLDNTVRAQTREQALRTQDVAAQRSRTELPSAPGSSKGPRTGELRLPSTSSGPRSPDQRTGPGSPGQPGSGLTAPRGGPGGPGGLPPGMGQPTGPGGRPPGAPGSMPPGGPGRPGASLNTNGPNARTQDHRQPFDPNAPSGTTGAPGTGAPSGGFFQPSSGFPGGSTGPSFPSGGGSGLPFGGGRGGPGIGPRP